MGDKMRPIPFTELIRRIFEEYARERSIFSLEDSGFFRKKGSKKVVLAGQWSETPIGPAAGPHTQLAQNMITSYLAGSRFIELKTVQEQEPPVDKPCIDAADECFNTEWSSEFTVEKAYEEYVKAWIILHLLEEVLALRNGKDHSFIFNMSVGYDLAGIQSPRMDSYINGLVDATQQPFFRTCLDELKALLVDGSFLCGTGLEARRTALTDLPQRISGKICSSVTLSTMHGCPPAEIEKICSYLLTEKKLATYVKLNPTLLSFSVVRKILNSLGFDYVELDQTSFDHDLEYGDAIPMLHRLQKLATENERFFGVKLTNTLGTVNFKQKLPGCAMYLSGRALFPLSIQLAAKICGEFTGTLPISFSGGISEHNVAAVFATGIRPITLATEILKPGGYNRMSSIAAKLEAAEGWEKSDIDVEMVKELASQALKADFSHKDYRGNDSVSIAGMLPQFDCAEAPCKIACPIHQDIPEYIRLVGKKRYSEALALIYEKNALPSITAHLCNHVCQYHCTRMDYEGCVLIREVKRIAIKMGFEDYLKEWGGVASVNGVKVAVMGAGPAGLAVAYFLAREGFAVTVFETRAAAGGTVRHIIPRFRISDEAIDCDVNFIKRQGVKFVFKADLMLTPKNLQAEQDFRYVVVAVGASAEKPFDIKNESKAKVLSALTFLEAYHQNSASLDLGRHVVVVGAGNTAMDTARTALKIAGVESACIIYRRTEKEMPAYREEYAQALADNVTFRFLLNPEKITAAGKLICRVMRLGEMDASGRPKPEPTDAVEVMAVDTLIVAIGEGVDQTLLKRLGMAEAKGIYLIGDAHTGPSSIVQAIADARQAADDICRKVTAKCQRQEVRPFKADDKQVREISGKKFGLTKQSKAPEGGSDELNLEVGSSEFRRCLECNVVCNKCVEVCPNRANIAVDMADDGDFANRFQIVHLDAYCNECANCATFCPWDGKPYLDKTTLFSRRDDFLSSTNPGFFVEGDMLLIRCEGKVQSFERQGGSFATGGSGALGKLGRLFNKLYIERKSLFGTVEE